MSLDELIKKCKHKEPRAQENLYRRYAGVLFALSLKYARNHPEAEDVLQDSFITIFEKIGQFKNKGSFEGWLKRIVINTALQRYRKQPVFNLVHEEQIEDEVVAVDESQLSLQFLLECVQELPDRYRLVFNLYALDGYSHKEVADLLGISEGTSKSNLARARMLLKQKVEQFQKQKQIS